MLETLKEKLTHWSQENYFEPVFFKGSDLIDDLVCFLNSDLNKTDFIITDIHSGSEVANIIFISGFINHKNLSLLKIKYDKLVGKKYVVTAGFMVNNELNFPDYNRAHIPKDFFIIDHHIYGINPSKADFVNAIISLVEKE